MAKPVLNDDKAFVLVSKFGTFSALKTMAEYAA